MAKRAAKPPAPKPAATDEDSGISQYPTTKYRKVPVTDKFPHGYEARQCETEDDEPKFDPSVWKDSPGDLAAKSGKRKPAEAAADESTGDAGE